MNQAQKIAMQRLLEIGFEIAGEWGLDQDAPRVQLERYASAANVLYAFVCADELLYIGRSVRSLRLRMEGYESGGPPHSMRTRNREKLLAMLKMDQPVEIYAMPDPGSLHYGSFRVNLAAGLQHSLVEALQPPWNNPTKDQSAGLPREQGANRARRRVHLFEPGRDAYTDLTSDRPGYRFLVGYHYMDKGFFNVPLRYSGLFGNDQEKIRILCGRSRETIHGHIDRAANTNGTPRVVGGRRLKRWFEQHTGLNNPVDIDILAPNAVWIRNPGTHF